MVYNRISVVRILFHRTLELLSLWISSFTDFDDLVIFKIILFYSILNNRMANRFFFIKYFFHENNSSKPNIRMSSLCYYTKIGNSIEFFIFHSYFKMSVCFQDKKCWLHICFISQRKKIRAKILKVISTFILSCVIIHNSFHDNLINDIPCLRAVRFTFDSSKWLIVTN